MRPLAARGLCRNRVGAAFDSQDQGGQHRGEPMPITWLDILLLVIMLVSGALAMIRGFLREVLSVAAWATAAIATILLYERLLPVAEANLGTGTLAKVA